MSRSVKVTEANWIEAPNYSFLRADLKSKHGAEPIRKIYEVLMIEGSPYLKVVGEDGRTLSAAQAQEEEQKLRREISRRGAESARERQKRIEKYTSDRNHDRAILTELCDAFDYTVSGEQRIDGREVWVLHGTPKPNYVAKSREAKVLAGMEVKFWIDKQTYQWPRVEAEVKTAVSMYGIAKVNPGTRFILEQQAISSNLWLPKRFQIQVSATAFGFINQDSTREETYSDYRRAGEATTASGGKISSGKTAPAVE
jgi:hypothetical protein